MGIRKADVKDWVEIGNLLEQLGYPDTEKFLKAKIEMLLEHPDEELLVYEIDNDVIALISIHFIPQIALEGDFARISYFCVDKNFTGKGIGSEIEEYCTHLAKLRNCDRIEVHCHSRREKSHKFYNKQGYIESPKYLIKMLK